MLLLKKRLIDLEELLEIDYKKLAYFQKDLVIQSNAPAKFELIQRIKTEVLPSLHEHELEYWGLLRQFADGCAIAEPEAQTAIATIVQEAEIIQAKPMPDQVLQKLQEILDKLNEPGIAAAAKAKFAVSLIPGFLDYEFELDTENSLRKVFQPLKRLFGEAAKK